MVCMGMCLDGDFVGGGERGEGAVLMKARMGGGGMDEGLYGGSMPPHAVGVGGTSPGGGGGGGIWDWGGFCCCCCCCW